MRQPIFNFQFSTFNSLGLLLAEAVETAEAPDDVGAVDAHYLPVGEAGLEDIRCLIVGQATIGGEYDFLIGNIEVGIAGGQPLVLIEHHVGHG